MTSYLLAVLHGDRDQYLNRPCIILSSGSVADTARGVLAPLSGFGYRAVLLGRDRRIGNWAGQRQSSRLFGVRDDSARTVSRAMPTADPGKHPADRESLKTPYGDRQREPMAESTDFSLARWQCWSSHAISHTLSTSESCQEGFRISRSILLTETGRTCH